MATLNNNQAATLVNKATAQATGAANIEELDLKGIVDRGNDPSVIGSREQFTKSLINVTIKNWYMDTSYRSEYDDPFYQDKERFGALTQAISVEVPEVKQSHAWTDYTSGTTTVGQYTVYLPVVSTQIYGKSISWALPITIADNQWDTAFRSESDLAGFVSYVWLCVDNGLVTHIESMNAANRNNFIAEKFAYAASQGATGVHAINLVAVYAKLHGLSSMTVDQYRTTPAALRNGSEEITKYAGYMRRMSTLFNTAHKKRFTPKDRLICEILTQFELDMSYNMEADTFHNDLVALPGHRSIPSWQGLVDANTSDEITFDAVSTINVNTSGDEQINQSGVVALLVDKWAIAHTLVDEYLAGQRFDIDRINHYEYQYTDRYINNLTLNGLVFYLADYTA